ncbi:MAG TPA: peptide chain release factor N(5)-glutamine methyltransferase [Steroidobacteraceae bacterium]|nr:peptide chain release factor N(5)-glutamine methyltransferase [Steroidobacteraceae bacterium]
MDGNLTVRALLAQAIEDLRGASGAPASVPLDAELLLGHALGMSRAQIRSHPETVPTDERAQRYRRLVQRRKLGEPVAYITGQREFWSLPLAVSPAVLVPRPETELLVERALSLHPQPTARVLELGTGSGAIALALASERPAWLITATDVSEEALVAARTNAATHGLQRVEFLRGSWFAPLAGRVFELVVSNPPYVAEADSALQSPALTYEPRLALAGGVDGLLCLRAIIREAPQYLERRGWLLLEHGAEQADAVARELVVRGFGHVRSHRDLAGHERMTEAQWL